MTFLDGLKKTEVFILPIVVFFCGMSVMIIELVGSRIIAPYVGTSIYVWTSLIGIVLGSLSLGYYFGGRWADKNASLKNLAIIIFVAGISTIAIIYLRYLSYYFGIFGPVFRASSIIYAPLLFFPSTFFFGMISPYTTRLYIKNIETSGSSIGRLYALSTIGSIVGTFLGGFFLVSYFGSSKILLILGILTLILSFFVYSLEKISWKFFVLVLIGIYISFFAFSLSGAIPVSGNILADIDTPYKRVWVYDTYDRETKKPIRILTDTIFGSQSGIFLDDPSKHLSKYQEYFDLSNHFNPESKKILMIGAGAFTYASDYLRKKPAGSIDVVEIDPDLKKISTDYFSLVEDPRLKIIHDDGRIFLNNDKNIYDSILMDAFNSLLSIPYQLTTKETVDNIYNKLSKNGVVIVNVISAIQGHRGEFLRAEYATYKSVFPTVLVFKVSESTSDNLPQNLILVGLKSENPKLVAKDAELNKLLQTLYKKEIALDMPILYDDFAPVEKYAAKMML